MIRFLPILTLALVAGCSGEIGDHYRDIADYGKAKSRLPAIAVKHFPSTAPEGSKMYGYFVPMQGGDGLQLSVKYEETEFDTLLAETESQNYESTVGVDMNDPETLLNGEISPLSLIHI